MDALGEAERLLSSMTREEKARLLRLVADDLAEEDFPGIESASGVSGGEPRVVRTRIPVWILERARRLGVCEAEILRSYPSLRAEDLSRAWAFADAHSEEIERQIRENEGA